MSSDVRDANRFTHGRYPTDRKLTPEEVEAWAAKAIERAREGRLTHDNAADGFVYFVFQDSPKGLVDAQPVFGRIPMRDIIAVVANRAAIGFQIKVTQGPPPGAPGLPGAGALPGTGPQRVN